MGGTFAVAIEVQAKPWELAQNLEKYLTQTRLPEFSPRRIFVNPHAPVGKRYVAEWLSIGTVGPHPPVCLVTVLPPGQLSAEQLKRAILQDIDELYGEHPLVQSVFDRYRQLVNMGFAAAAARMSYGDVATLLPLAKNDSSLRPLALVIGAAAQETLQKLGYLDLASDLMPALEELVDDQPTHSDGNIGYAVRLVYAKTILQGGGLRHAQELFTHLAEEETEGARGTAAILRLGIIEGVQSPSAPLERFFDRYSEEAERRITGQGIQDARGNQNWARGLGYGVARNFELLVEQLRQGLVNHFSHWESPHAIGLVLAYSPILNSLIALTSLPCGGDHDQERLGVRSRLVGKAASLGLASNFEGIAETRLALRGDGIEIPKWSAPDTPQTLGEFLGAHPGDPLESRAELKADANHALKLYGLPTIP